MKNNSDDWWLFHLYFKFRNETSWKVTRKKNNQKKSYNTQYLSLLIELVYVIQPWRLIVMIGDFFIFILKSGMGRMEDLEKDLHLWESLHREVEYLITFIYIYVCHSTMKNNNDDWWLFYLYFKFRDGTNGRSGEGESGVGEDKERGWILNYL